MRYLEMGLAFAVLGFVFANAMLSAVTALLWRGVRRFRCRARTLFLLRMLPALGSAAFVLGVVVPAYLRFEPRETSERAGPALAVLVLITGVLIGAALRRVVASWLETRNLERSWKAAGVKSSCLGIPADAYRVRTDMPLAALVGVLRPRFFVSERLFDALSAGERQAVVDHETGHLRSRDNLKRSAMKLAPDWLPFCRAGREIETAWAIAAEDEADDRAAGRDRGRSLDLASALIKAARLTPLPCAPVSNFSDTATIARRVTRLLDDGRRHREPAGSRAPGWALALAFVGVTGVAAEPVLRAVYTVTEAAVRLLDFGSW